MPREAKFLKPLKKFPKKQRKQKCRIILSQILNRIQTDTSTADTTLTHREADLSIHHRHSKQLKAQTTLSKIHSKLIPSRVITSRISSIRTVLKGHKTCRMHPHRCRRRTCLILRELSHMRRICHTRRTVRLCRRCIPPCRLSHL